jgi:hypothetical protein
VKENIMRLRIAWLLVLLTLFVAAPSKAAPKGEKATLVCRMGGAMVWSYISQIDIVPSNLNGKQVRVPVVAASFAQLLFSKAKTAAGETGETLLPGTCAWSDRPMRADEPARLIERSDSFTMQQTVRWGNGSTVGGSTSFSGGNLDQQNKAVFKMTVMRGTGDVQLYVTDGTSPKIVASK